MVIQAFRGGVGIFVFFWGLFAHAAPVDQWVDHITSAFPAGNHLSVPTQRSYSLSMVREYLERAHPEAGAVDEHYELLLQWSTQAYMDSPVAGTMTREAALNALNEGLEKQENRGGSPASNEKLRQIFEQMSRSQGVFFGFDGKAKNDCGATLQLLILDSRQRKAHGIDLLPCKN